MSLEHRNFDQEAEQWDERPQRVQLAKDVADAILGQLPQTANLDVLDFGCGTGLLTLQLQPLVHTITGLDSSPGMLAVLNRKIANLKLANARTVLCDVAQGQKLPGRYDLVVSSMTLHHVERIAPLLELFFAVLVPGGRLCIADLDPEQGRFHADTTGVFHCGFERDQLCATLSTVGFHQITAQTAAQIVNNDSPQRPEPFSVFLISAKKP